MEWQDLVFGVGNIILNIAIVPSLLSEAKPARTTSIMMAAVLTSFLVAYISLGFVLASCMIAVGIIGWIVLAIQRHLQIRQEFKGAGHYERW